MKYDVAVIGASPAGIMAAISSAKTGASTILIDRDFWIYRPANTLFQGMASRAPQMDLKGVVLHDLDGMRLISPNEHALLIDAKGYFLDRKAFDKRYIDIARDNGVEIREGSVDGIKLSNEPARPSNEPTRWKLVTKEGDVHADVVIDAGGVDSTVSHNAGLKPMRHPEDIAWAFEATVLLPGLGDEDHFEYWLGSIAPGWKATFSPAGDDTATLGVFVRGHGRDVKPFFDRFFQLFKKSRASSYKKIDEMKVLRTVYGGDPIATLPREIVSDGLMVTGGAAGQSGLAYSIRAGEICGEVAGSSANEGDTSRQALLRYEKRWQVEFGWEYRVGRACLETLKDLSDDDIDDLIKALAGKDLLPSGALAQKVFNSSITVARAKPLIIPSLVRNLMKG